VPTARSRQIDGTILTRTSTGDFEPGIVEQLQIVRKPFP